MSDERKNWLDRVGVIHLWNTIKAALDDKVDKFCIRKKGDFWYATK